MENKTLNNLLTLSDLTETVPQLKPFEDIIQSIMELPEDILTSQTIEEINNTLLKAIPSSAREQSIKEIINNFRNNNISKTEAYQSIVELKNAINDFIFELKPSPNKKILLNNVFNIFYDIFDSVANNYLIYDIELPIQLEEGAKSPTYAHKTDAAADLYALEGTVIRAHSLSNLINTGVHIGLPEGWMAMIFPRSSIGAKTGLRLSNSVGIIDSEYRGPLGVLYDNISDSDYTINAGDRIAQLIIMPNYHFKEQIVDHLTKTERGQGGFGSSGK